MSIWKMIYLSLSSKTKIHGLKSWMITECRDLSTKNKAKFLETRNKLILCQYH